MVSQAARSKVKIDQTKKKPTQKKRLKKVAVIVSLFNEDICLALEKGCLDVLAEDSSKIQSEVFHVAGAFEIPFILQKILRTKKYAGAVTLGCVIRGDTPHFEYVCQGVMDGCLRVQLDESYPVAFGVLTTNNREQAEERAQNNEFNKGREAALALLDTFKTMESI